MIKSDASSSTKTSFNLHDDFFLPIQWRGSEVGNKSSTTAATMAVELKRLGFSKGQMLKSNERVRKKKKKKKKKEEEGP
jgi:hypothetical protein